MKHLAYCGFDCGECPVYQAKTIEEKTELRDVYWQTKSPEDIACLGCKDDNPAFMCLGCKIRLCCREKGHMHCGKCGQYPCEIIETSLPPDSPGRKVLDKANMTD